MSTSASISASGLKQEMQTNNLGGISQMSTTSHGSGYISGNSASDCVRTVTTSGVLMPIQNRHRPGPPGTARGPSSVRTFTQSLDHQIHQTQIHGIPICGPNGSQVYFRPPVPVSNASNLNASNLHAAAAAIASATFPEQDMSKPILDSILQPVDMTFGEYWLLWFWWLNFSRPGPVFSCLFGVGDMTTIFRILWTISSLGYGWALALCACSTRCWYALGHLPYHLQVELHKWVIIKMIYLILSYGELFMSS